MTVNLELALEKPFGVLWVGGSLDYGMLAVENCGWGIKRELKFRELGDGAFDTADGLGGSA